MNSIAAVKGLASTSPEFRWALFQTAHAVSVDPDFIATVISLESGGTFSPSSFNPDGGATGLIQFMPSTARRLGTTTDALRAMTAIEQLEYVRRFYEPWAGRLASVGNTYMATFLPNFVGAPRETIVGEKNSSSPIASGSSLTLGKVYASNSGFDSNKDGRITAGEVYGFAERRLLAAQGRIEVFPPAAGGSDGSTLPLLLVFGGLVYLANRYL